MAFKLNFSHGVSNNLFFIPMCDNLLLVVCREVHICCIVDFFLERCYHAVGALAFLCR